MLLQTIHDISRMFLQLQGKKSVLKTVNLPIPKLNLRSRELLLTQYPYFATSDIARLIVAQHSNLSFDGQRRLVQYAIAALRRYDLDFDDQINAMSADFAPMRRAGTDYYNRKATKVVLEYMEFDVTDDEKPHYQEIKI